MKIKILVIHQYTVLKKIVTNFVCTEYSDASVESVTDPEEGVELLRQKSFDIVLSGFEMAGLDGIAIKDQMTDTEINKDTPFVIMTSSYNENQIEKLKGYGIQHILSIPFTRRQLRRFISEILDPIKNRVYNRYVIPDTKAEIRVENQVINCNVINVSLKGLLCELVYPEQSPNLFNKCHLNIQFSKDYKNVKVSDIKACLLRSTVTSWRDYNRPHIIRVAWKFVFIPAENENVLDLVLQKTHKSLSKAELAANAE